MTEAARRGLVPARLSSAAGRHWDAPRLVAAWRTSEGDRALGQLPWLCRSIILAAKVIGTTAFLGSTIQLYIELRDVSPAIWRRMVVSAEVTLDVLHGHGTAFLYRYDCGDDWEHTITVESVSELGPDPMVVECLAGARACPPEDCGGSPGYEDLLRILADPTDPEHRNMKTWVGPRFDPDRFDLDKVNKKVGALARRLRQGRRVAGRRWTR